MIDPPEMDEVQYALLNVLRCQPEELTLEEIASLQKFCRFLLRHVDRLEQWGNRTVILVQDLQSLVLPEDRADGDRIP